MIRKLLQSLAVISSLQVGAQTYVEDSVNINTSADRKTIFYSLKNGKVAEASVAGWDLGFAEGGSELSIRCNDIGNGSATTKVWKTKIAFDGTVDSIWKKLDTTGIVRKYNSPNFFLRGAFDQPYSPAGTGFQLGWGVYSQGGTAKGDTIFLVQTQGGNWKKVYVKNYFNSSNPTHPTTYEVLIGNLSDTTGASDTTIYVAKGSASGKYYTYLNLDNYQILNWEPTAKNTYDIVFRRYVTDLLFGPNYYSTHIGVLLNNVVSPLSEVPGAPAPPAYSTVLTKVITGVKADSAVKTYSTNPVGASSKYDQIGYKWQSITDPYQPADSTSYFVKAQNGDIYHLVFTAFTSKLDVTGNVVFDGASPTRWVKFKKAKLISAGIENQQGNLFDAFTVFPNPANENVTVLFSTKTNAAVELQITDLAGKQAYTQKISTTEGLQAIPVSVKDLPKGLYLVTLREGVNSISSKILVQE